MKFTGYFVYVYAFIVIIGGLVGYLKADSLASLIMGSCFGIMLLGSGYAMAKEDIKGFYAAQALSLVLTLFFLYRFIISYKFMPAGMMALLSLGVFSMLVFTLQQSAVKAKE